MLSQPDIFNPDARCCWECRHGNGDKPSKRKTIICDVDEDIVFRLVPGLCPSFSENERAAKRRKRRLASIAKAAFPGR